MTPISRLLCFIIVLTSTHAVLCQTNKPSPPTAPKPRPTSDALKKERAFDPFVPRHAAEKLLAIDNFQVKSMGLARLAALIWKQDEGYARTLFEKALAVTNPQNNTSDGLRKFVYRTVISVIATKDPAWARRLIEALASVDERTRNSANIDTAVALIDQSPGQAVEFAQRALSERLHPRFLDFLMALRKADQARADQMFLQVLRFLGQQQPPNVQDLHRIGLYLFTKEDLIDSEYFGMTLVDTIIVPHLSVQRPGMSPAAVQAYLTTAGSLLLRAATDKEQKRFIFALGRLLLPKARMSAPEVVQQIEAAMSAVSSDVSPTLVEDSAFKYIDMKPPTPEESLANAEQKPDQLERDMAFLDIAAAAWRKSDFKTARKAASAIQEIEVSQALGQLIDFGEAGALLKGESSNVAAAEKVAYKLSPGLERAILLMAIAQNRVRGGSVAQAEEAIDASLKAAAAVTDARRACLALIATGQLAQLRSSRAPIATASTIRDLNAFETVNYAAIQWNRDVRVGALEASFSLEFSGLDLSLERALRAIFLSDLEIGFARAQEIKNEILRSRALVEFVAAYLEKLERDAREKPPSENPK